MADPFISHVLSESPNVKFNASLQNGENFNGRAAIFWDHTLDQYVPPIIPQSTHFASIKITYTESPPIILSSCYLPTHGRDALFLDALSDISAFISLLLDYNPECVFLFGGDFNVNPKNKTRAHTWRVFLHQYACVHLEVLSNTYHRHIGGGGFDSILDGPILLNYSPLAPTITLIKQICPLVNNLFDSRHDVLVTNFSMNTRQSDPPIESNAPTVEIPTVRVRWTDKGILKYQESLAPILSQILDDWSPTNNISLFITFYMISNNLLVSHATMCSKPITIPPPPRKPPRSPELSLIRKS